MNKESTLVEGAMSIFMRFGIKSVNMDDIAKQLSISKKTLYQYFSDKEDLLSRALDLHMTTEESSIKEIISKKLSAIDEMFEIMHWVLGILNKVHPAVQYDLEKYHPQLALKMKQHRADIVNKCILKNLLKGQKEGLYRKDFNPDIITRLYLVRVESFLDPEVFPFDQFKAANVYRESFQYHIRGIASDEGLIQLNKMMKKNKVA
jgi:TetR/AcrR family transcriptional regulator, cholesterol catabolism regulator